MIRKKDLPDCPVATTMNLINSKWKIFILQRLEKRPWRYNELKKSIDGISQKVLTDSLHSLESDGLVQRKIFDEIPPHVEYSLTKLGEEFKLILDTLYDFGLYYKKQILSPAQI
ncbi:MAG: helix-turn-helix transcriptional regulator [Selenomonadaceae bacterium]|nr:helix-turn-helix transcriptional regulator [Selenomonadaceae bacterium]